MRMHPIQVGLVLNKPSWGGFFLEKFKGTSVPHFLIGLYERHEYGLKFAELSHYAPEMVKDMRSKTSLIVATLGRASSKEGRTAMLIGDMDISRLMVYVL